jgi:hypothetical protein
MFGVRPSNLLRYLNVFQIHGDGLHLGNLAEEREESARCQAELTASRLSAMGPQPRKF